MVLRLHIYSSDCVRVKVGYLIVALDKGVPCLLALSIFTQMGYKRSEKRMGRRESEFLRIEKNEN